MAKELQFSIVGHPSIYTSKHDEERVLNVYLGIPDYGINSDTGILLNIAGFGGNARSNVYRKMRRIFPDKYNLVTIQCDYFGYEFMQTSSNPSFQIESDELKHLLGDAYKNYLKKNKADLLKLIFSKADTGKIRIEGKEQLKETLHNFNDMGIMQAIDNVGAILATIYIIEDNKYEFNKGKIILYGHSHGAYLAYLCNFLAPDLCTLIIDNSAWLYPAYLDHPRYLVIRNGNLEAVISFDYLARKIPQDREFLDLNNLYMQFNNKCRIISFQGVTDTLVNRWEKRSFCRRLNNCSYIEITPENVEGIVFKSTNHGLDADFIALFDHVMKNFSLTFHQKEKIDLSSIIYKSEKWQYIIDYSKGLPVVSRVSN